MEAVSLIPRVVWSHSETGLTYMDLKKQLSLSLSLLSCNGSYACLELVFIEESVKMMRNRRGPHQIRSHRISSEFALAAPFWSDSNRINPPRGFSNVQKCNTDVSIISPVNHCCYRKSCVYRPSMQ